MFCISIIISLVVAVNANGSSNPVSKVDLVFLLDGSGSVQNSGFELVKTWVKNMTRRLNLETTYLGVIQYSHYFASRSSDNQIYIKTEIPLGRHEDRDAFEASVAEIAYQGFTTYTARAILHAVDDFKTSDRFNDADTKKVLILITDGKSNDRSLLPESVKALQSANIYPYAVGVGDADRSELEIIAGSKGRVFQVTDFSGLDRISSDIFNEAFTTDIHTHDQSKE